MDRLQAITAFVQVVETGSFARAAERMQRSVSSVSRQVADLEAHLDARLLNRTTRRLSLTEAGRSFFERSVQLLADLAEAEESASSGAARPRGTLRITAAITFGIRHLAPVVAEFIVRHPELRLDLDLSDSARDLVDEGFDVALRIGSIGSQNVVGRRVSSTRMVCCAAPAYLQRAGTPRTPEELATHACLTYEYLPAGRQWMFRDGEGRERAVRVSGPVHANNGRFLERLAAAGVGIVFEPDFIVGPEVRSGALVPILQAFMPPESPIFVAYASRRHLSAKVRAFADFLAERLAEPDWRLPATDGDSRGAT